MFKKLMQTITVTIPDNGRQIFESIKDVIEGFGNIVKDPKTALARIGKGAVQYVFLKDRYKCRIRVSSTTTMLNIYCLYVLRRYEFL